MLPVKGPGNSGPSHSHSNPRRPDTSRPESARPGTSFGQTFPQGQQPFHPQYGQYGDQYDNDQFAYHQQYPVEGQYGIVEEEYEEESDDEDVFAFLPPSTAEAAMQGESNLPVEELAPDVTQATGVAVAAPQSQVYYYPTFQAPVDNPFAYRIPSNPADAYEPPTTVDSQDLPPPTTMDSSLEAGAFAYEPPTDISYPSHYHSIGSPPVSPFSSDMDSQPSTGYGHVQGGDAFKLEKIRSSSVHAAVSPNVGESVINEEDEGEGEPTQTSDEQRPKDEEEATVAIKDPEGKFLDAMGLGREVDLGADVDARKGYDPTEGVDANLERGPEDVIAERKIPRGRKKSRNERSARKSGGRLASGNAQREGDTASTEGEPTAVRKRKNVNAGPYLNYPHPEKTPGGRSGRGMFYLYLKHFIYICSHPSRNSTYSDIAGNDFASLPY